MAKPPRSLPPAPIRGKTPIVHKAPLVQMKSAAARTVPPPPVKFGAQPLLTKQPKAVSGTRHAPPAPFGKAARPAGATMQPASRSRPRTDKGSPPVSGPAHRLPEAPAQQKPKAGKAPAAHRAIQPMIVKKWITDFSLPKGVELVKFLQMGVCVGYSAAESTVGLYRSGKLIAHVEIDPKPSTSTIVLHTRTDSGDAGGQGYLTVLFPEALKIVWKHFSHYTEINMAPAPGAATKGLISQLARLRLGVVGGPPTRFAEVRTNMAREFIGKADKLRQIRKEAEKSGLRARPGVQDWDSASMLETAWELNALQELEFASSTGLVISGTTGAFYEQLVGSVGTPYLPGGALAWHESGAQQNMGMVLLRMPMASVPAYIAALPNY